MHAYISYCALHLRNGMLSLWKEKRKILICRNVFNKEFLLLRGVEGLQWIMEQINKNKSTKKIQAKVILTVRPIFDVHQIKPTHFNCKICC